MYVIINTHIKNCTDVIRLTHMFSYSFTSFLVCDDEENNGYIIIISAHSWWKRQDDVFILIAHLDRYWWQHAVLSSEYSHCNWEYRYYQCRWFCAWYNFVLWLLYN